MSAGGAAMPELGSKISLISKADIRYEGRLFTVDPQECTIALSNVRSFGTEDRECSFPVSPQNQIYDYILFRGSDIKDIRVVNTVVPNDPAIVTLSAPQAMGSSNFQQSQAQVAQQAPVFGGNNLMGPIRSNVPPFGSSYNSVAANLTSSMLSHQDSAKILSSECPEGPVSPPRPGGAKVDESPMDLMSGRAMTPVGGSRKSPTADQSTQSEGKNNQMGAVGSRGGYRQQGEYHRGRGGPHRGGGGWNDGGRMENDNRGWGQQQNNRGGPGGWRGGARRGRGGRGGAAFIRGGGQQQQHQGGQQHQQQQGNNAQNQKKNVLKFEGDYDFEQANTEFENLRSQLAKIKITATAAGSSNAGIKMATAADVTPDQLKAQLNGGEVTEIKEKPIESENDEDNKVFYDKEVSFFDNISCEAIERSKGASQRTDWRQERKLNSETFGVSSARRGYRGGRGGYYRGGSGYRGNYNNRGGGYRGHRGGYNNQRNQQNQPQQQQQQQQQQQPVGAQRGKQQN